MPRITRTSRTSIGYFEHQGAVRGNQDIAIGFTSRQLNDVLKSLTTIDANASRSHSWSRAQGFRNAEKPMAVRELSILGDTGQVRSFEITPTLNVRVVDRNMRQSHRRRASIRAGGGRHHS